jgi:hypothetical protein
MYCNTTTNLHALQVYSNHCLDTALNNGDSSAHVLQRCCRDSSKFRPCPNNVQSIYEWCLAVPRTRLALFAEETCIYVTEKHGRHVLCNLQRGLTAVKSWCERRNISTDEGITQTHYFSRRLKSPWKCTTTKYSKVLVSRCHVRQEEYMAISRWKDCSQDLAHVRKDLFSIQKLEFKYKY